MKKLHFIFFSLLASFLFSACSDNDLSPEEEYALSISKVYRGKDLTVMLNNDTVNHKKVIFISKDMSSTDVTLLKIIPGEDSLTLKGLQLEPYFGVNGYGFKGTATNEQRIVDVTGHFSEGKLTVCVDHKITAPITGSWQWKSGSRPSTFALAMRVVPKSPEATMEMYGMNKKNTIKVSDLNKVETISGLLSLVINSLNCTLTMESSGQLMAKWKPTSMIPLEPGEAPQGLLKYNLNDKELFLAIALDSLLTDIDLSGGSLSSLSDTDIDYLVLLDLAQKAYNGMPLNYTLNIEGDNKILEIVITRDMMMPYIDTIMKLIRPSLDNMDMGNMAMLANLYKITSENIPLVVDELTRVIKESQEFDLVLSMRMAK